MLGRHGPQVDPTLPCGGPRGLGGSVEPPAPLADAAQPRTRAGDPRYRERTLEGPHRIGWALGEAPATVHRVLRRLGVPRLRDLDRPTRTVVRYERERPGELVHVDVKKQGRIPPGGGWRMHGRARMTGSRRHRGHGYDFIHAAVDDRSGSPTPRSCPTSDARPPRPS